jgi:hypothetical protein
MHSLVTGVAALAAIVGVELPLALADGSTSPGDTSVFVSKADINLDCTQAAIITATIKKGKPHHVLMVQAMMLFEGYLPPVTGLAVISARPTVNGIAIEPSGHTGVTHFSMGQQCLSNVTFCTITVAFSGSTWMLPRMRTRACSWGSRWTSLCRPELATVAEALFLTQRWSDSS